MGSCGCAALCLMAGSVFRCLQQNAGQGLVQRIGGKLKAHVMHRLLRLNGLVVEGERF